MKPLGATVFLSWLIALQFCIAQESGNKTIDSLEKVLKGQMADSSRVKTLIGLAGEHYYSDPDLAIKDCESALAVAERAGFEEGAGEALGWLAYLHEQKGNIDTALSYYQRSLQLAIKTKSRKAEATVLNNIAAIYDNRGESSQALSLYQKSLAIREELKDSAEIATSFNNIAFIYQGRGRIPEALDYYSKALKIFEQVNDKEGEAVALLNIGFIYKDQQQYENASGFFFKCLALTRSSGDKYNLGYVLNSIGGLYEDQQETDSALYYYSESLKIRTGIDDRQGMAFALKNIGNIYEKLGRKEDARKAFEKSLILMEELKDKRGLSDVNNLFGSALLQAGQYTESERYLDRSLQLARELGYPVEIRNAAGNLQQLYRKRNQWKDALLMNDLYIKMRDSVENDVNRKAALKVQARYEYEKKETELKNEQEKKNVIAAAEIRKQKIIRNAVTGGLAAVALFLVIVFRQRNRIASEKKRSDDLLLNILPEETAAELKQTGTAKAKSYDLVTVLFSDFKNFTQASEKLSPEDLVAEINFCYSEFDKIITKYHIEKIKTIGDAYMCAGGLPVQNTTNPSDVVRAGLEMVAFIEKNKQQRIAKNQPYFELRCGIHTGPVVAGIVGIKKFAYDIWGDTVNIASRMESSGASGKVNISQATYELVKEKFKCSYRGKIDAKNKGQMEMYFVEQSVGEV